MDLESIWFRLSGTNERGRAGEGGPNGVGARGYAQQNAMRFVIVETFRGGDAVPVYRRFRDRGRLAADGLRYIASWVSQDFTRCYQVMECEDRTLLDQWVANWHDLVEFEIIPAMTSEEAAAAIAPLL
jgi:hypothetical protein